MNKIEVLLSELRKLDINLWLDGENLRCNAPKGTLTPELRSRLADHKGEIIQFLQNSYQKAKLISEMIETIPRNQPIPLSFAQQRLWFLAQLEQDNSPYNECFAFKIEGNLSVEILRKSLRKIVERHEILRTNFKQFNGSIVQIISPQISLDILEIIDLQELAETDLDNEVKKLINQIIEKPFDLANDFLLRATLLQLGKDCFVLVLCLHHIISDGWSMGIFTGELSQLYPAFLQGLDSPLTDLEIQYADFAHWQRRWLTGEVLENQLHYWKEQLAGLPPLLDLPTDQPRPPRQTFQGKTEVLSISRELTEKLQNLSQKSGTTLFMVLLAVLSILLYRYSQQEDIAIGTPIANRNRREIEPLIGFFVNTLVLRLNLSENPQFYHLLAQVRRITLEAYAHQDVPFEKLVEELKPERSLSHTPLFQVMFAWQNISTEILALDKLKITPWATEGVVAKFDLSLFMTEIEGQLVGNWEYNCDIFQPETIIRINQHFQNLLVSVVEQPQEKIANLSLLSPAEKQQLLVEWNQTQRGYDLCQCLHKLIEDQVKRTPEAIAVRFENDSLSYEQLNCRANQLAHYLQKLGVNSQVLVGICLERSLDMVVGLLGILKAGGAYVPLDPGYPQERLAYVLEDCGASILLTQDKLIKQLPKNSGQIISLDKDWPKIATYAIDNPKSLVKAEDLAYVIYTSGSTGKPKGVQILHRGVVNFLNSMAEKLNPTQEDLLLSVTTLSFDIAVLEIFLPLLKGSQVLIVSREIASDGRQLLDILSTQPVTLMQGTPSTWRLLLDAGWEGTLGLKMLCGGEALPQELVEQLLERGRSLWNLYGPTETTIWSTACELKKGQKISIGRGIANTQLYVLDRHRQPVPVGVMGELYIGGEGLARGYLHREDLTQEKFVVNPFRDGNTERLYRTGDMVRYLEDGTIEYLGRIDYQVKLRGFRIELGEIEAVLTQHPEVKEAVVIVNQELTGFPQLVAYLVSNFIPERIPYHQRCSLEFEGKNFPLEVEDISERGINLKGMKNSLKIGSLVHLLLKLPGESQETWLDGQVVWHKEEHIGVEFKLDSLEEEHLRQNFQQFLTKNGWWQLSQRTLTDHLRHYLSEKLPDYMIPNAFVLMDAFPLTPNGKIDRRSLPNPQSFEASLHKDFKTPQTATEKMLAAIWSEVLRLKEVGLEDNFFALGGHSLLVTQVVSRLRTELNLEIPVRKLFEAPTLKQFAQIIDAMQEQESGLSVPAIRRVSRDARRMKRSSLNNNS